MHILQSMAWKRFNKVTIIRYSGFPGRLLNPVEPEYPTFLQWRLPT